MYLDTRCASYAGVRDEVGTACCAASCGTCGGFGCETRPGGPDNCCVGQITQVCGSGQDARSSGQKAPCLLRNGKYLLQKWHCTVFNIVF